ncbi:MAG: hypothetical protein JOZ19_07570 [Rubrobacter sp.]|nr:hypothetical protein [Rubrobacter sp.]
MHYLIKFKTERSELMERIANRDNVYIVPEGGWGWAILESGDEQSLRQDLQVQEAEEVQPVLPVREYLAVLGAREYFNDSKARFLDDPSGALVEARQAVGQALEARGYPPPERANEAPRARQEVLQEYQDTNIEDSSSLEDVRDAFNRLSDLLDRLTHT